MCIERVPVAFKVVPSFDMGRQTQNYEIASTIWIYMYSGKAHCKLPYHVFNNDQLSISKFIVSRCSSGLSISSLPATPRRRRRWSSAPRSGSAAISSGRHIVCCGSFSLVGGTPAGGVRWRRCGGGLCSSSRSRTRGRWSGSRGRVWNGS